MKFIPTIIFFMLAFSTNATADIEDIDLNTGASDSYSPLSYQANCSYLNDPNCGGQVYNPATGSTTYVGQIPGSYSNNDYRGRRGHHRHGSRDPNGTNHRSGHGNGDKSGHKKGR